MQMFKRVEKHRQRKEDADNLALGERWQEILGLHDTDSEESASEGSECDSDEDEQTCGRPEYSEDEEGDDEEMTVSQALIDPLYVASFLQPEIKACIICPGKLLKGLKMEELHLASNACMLLLANHGFNTLITVFRFIRHMSDGSRTSTVLQQMLNLLRALGSCSDPSQKKT
jgi:hypothetical protein